MPFVSDLDFSDEKWTWKKFCPSFKNLLEYVNKLESTVESLQKKIEEMETFVVKEKRYPAVDLSLKERVDVLLDIADNNVYHGILEKKQEVMGMELNESLTVWTEDLYSSQADQLLLLWEGNKLYPLPISEAPSDTMQDDNVRKESWAGVTKRKPVVVKGAREVKPEDPKGSVVSVLELKHKPHLDKCVRGMRRLKDTEFKNVKDYNGYLKQQLEEGGIPIRFIRVYLPARDDRRGSTWARVSCFKEDQSKIMTPDLWPKNVYVREWFY